MPVTEKLTRKDLREIEAMLKTEIERKERLGNPHASEALMEALERLRDGSYGQCMYCGNAIPAGRLLVIPEATNCLGCGNAA
ncbi:MAG TPA: TraR/DksA C4-type zinc finger protein [Gemmatimonadaceae bacterium]